MYYKFPLITNIKQALDAIEGKEEFIVAEREGYKVINYVVRKEDTFPPVISEREAILRECRGLVFDTDGRVLSRAFHKFFNVGELDETQPHLINLNANHYTQEKLDGSFIRPLLIGEYIRWATKMGITSVSMLAEQYVVRHPQYEKFARYCYAQGLTPIFEFISPNNRIVVPYQQDDLVMLAIRVNDSGEYLPNNTLCTYGAYWNIPVVRKVTLGTNINDVLQFVRDLNGIEGFVIVFDNGHRVKIKTEEYVTMHRTKDAIGLEKNVIDAIVTEKIDDMLPLLPQQDRDKLHAFAEKFWDGIQQTEKKVIDVFENRFKKECSGERKQFALLKDVDPRIKSMVFRMIDGHTGLEPIIDTITKNTGSSTSIDKVRSLWGNHKWEYNGD